MDGEEVYGLITPMEVTALHFTSDQWQLGLYTYHICSSFKVISFEDISFSLSANFPFCQGLCENLDKEMNVCMTYFLL